MKKLTKRILIQLNLLAAVGIILAYTANFISPVSVWPIAFFGLAYPYLLISNIFFLGIWIWRKNKFAFISLIAILLGFNNIGRYIQVNLVHTDVHQDSTLKILTYNVRIFNTYKWNGEDVGRDSIIHFVNSIEPDIICFQEFLTQGNIKDATEAYTNRLLKSTPYSYVRYTLEPSGISSKGFGIATFCKYPIIRKGSVNFDKSRNSCIYTDFVFNGDTIRLYNLHLQSTSLKKNYTIVDSLIYINSKRIGEVKDISERLKDAFIRRALQVDAVKKHINESPYPVILCGDFNDTPVSYTYQQLLGDKFDSFREAGNGIGRTYLGKLPSYRIDYVFHDNFFTSLSYSSPRVNLSDHYPVVSLLKKR